MKHGGVKRMLAFRGCLPAVPRRSIGVAPALPARDEHFPGRGTVFKSAFVRVEMSGEGDILTGFPLHRPVTQASSGSARFMRGRLSSGRGVPFHWDGSSVGRALHF